jgi:hypothetical protein
MPTPAPTPSDSDPDNPSNQEVAMVTLVATGGDGKIDLSWTVKGEIKSIQVYRDVDANPSGRQRIAILRGDARRYTDTTAVSGQQYWYWIKYVARYPDDEVGNSNAGSATPQ